MSSRAGRHKSTMAIIPVTIASCQENDGSAWVKCCRCRAARLKGLELCSSWTRASSMDHRLIADFLDSPWPTCRQLIRGSACSRQPHCRYSHWQRDRYQVPATSQRFYQWYMAMPEDQQDCPGGRGTAICSRSMAEDTAFASRIGGYCRRTAVPRSHQDAKRPPRSRAQGTSAAVGATVVYPGLVLAQVHRSLPA